MDHLVLEHEANGKERNHEDLHRRRDQERSGSRLVPLLGRQRTRGRRHDAIRRARSVTCVPSARAGRARRPRRGRLLGRAVAEARPAVVVHQATALSDLSNLRNLDEAFEADEPPANCRHGQPAGGCEGGRRAGSSWPRALAGWPYAKEGSAVKDEEAPLDPVPAVERRADHGRDSSPRGHPSPAPRRSRGSRSGTAAFTGLVRRCSRVASTSRGFASAHSRSSVAVPGCASFIHIDDVASRDARRNRARPARSVQHRRRRAGGDDRVASLCGRRARREAAPSPAGVARAARGRRSSSSRDHGGSWRIEREGEA